MALHVPGTALAVAPVDEHGGDVRPFVAEPGLGAARERDDPGHDASAVRTGAQSRTAAAIARARSR